MGITHSFVSAKSDSADSTLIKPSDWNAAHVIGDGSMVLDSTAGSGTLSIPGGVGIFDFGSSAFPATYVITTDETGAGGGFIGFADSASPAANDLVFYFQANGRNTVGAVTPYGEFDFIILNSTSGAESGQINITVPVAGAQTAAFGIANGVVVGSPTGSFKGTGTANFAGDIYKNNSAYTNPDYVLEHWDTGQIVKFAKNEGAEEYQGLMPIDEVESTLRKNHRLPGISDEPLGAFARTDVLLAKLEEAFIYITQLHNRIAALEGKISA